MEQKLLPCKIQKKKNDFSRFSQLRAKKKKKTGSTLFNLSVPSASSSGKKTFFFPFHLSVARKK